jgi:molybdopterin/thiamine biosynthesis adenylyltransferase
MASVESRAEFQPAPNQYQDYPGRPRLIEAEEAIQTGVIEPLVDGRVIYRPQPVDQGRLGAEIILSPNQVSDIVLHTFEGLHETVVGGTEIGQQLEAEWEKFTERELAQKPYGFWAYYPKRENLVRMMDPFWSRLSLVVSNSELYMDPGRRMSWREVRKVFENTTVAIAGCSVGNRIAYCCASNLRPLQIKVADPKDAHLANAQRVNWSYSNIGENKAIVTAEQLHEIDPFLSISVYPGGVHEENINDFIGGNKSIGEPKPDIVIEETDDPEKKIDIRKVARKYRVPVLMVTDAGSIVQMDIRRFDLDPNLSLAVGITDEELYAARNKALKDPGNRQKFFDFAFTMIGTDCLWGEFEMIARKESFEPLFGSIPQLGSTASVAGGWAAEAVCRMVLGYSLPERRSINLQTGEVAQEGEYY